jgi:hypothetical protein
MQDLSSPAVRLQWVFVMQIALKQSVFIFLSLVLLCYMFVQWYVCIEALEQGNGNANAEHLEAFGLDATHDACHFETGPSSEDHEDAINRLDGKRLVFIGDSITRFVRHPFSRLLCSEHAEMMHAHAEISSRHFTSPLSCIVSARA